MSVKGRALIGKEWAPESWNGDMWEHSQDISDAESLNSDESSLSVEGAFLPPMDGASLPLSEGVNPALPEKTVMASPEAVALQDDVYFPQEQPLPTPLLLDLYLHSSLRRIIISS